jgi:hypothetical protein
LLLAKKQQKWSMTFWAGTLKETKANQKIWHYSSPNEKGKIYEICSSSGAVGV